MEFFSTVQSELIKAACAIIIPAPFFLILGFVLKGRQLLTDMRRALHETKINILIHFTNEILVAPFLILLIVFFRDFFSNHQLTVISLEFWDKLNPVLVGFVAVFLADFIGYWRHRLEHTTLLWPSHATHHSDEEMTWLAIFRFHPINRLTTTAIDFLFLTACGLPTYAVIVAALVKHNYGAFVHAELPWTYGRFGKLFVSPAMHRWHHACDTKAFNTNYATVFSFLDWAFGTFRVPGPCNVRLGVPEDMGKGFFAQMTYPIKPSSYRNFSQNLTRGSQWLKDKFK